MVHFVYTEDGGKDAVFGFVSHSQWDEFPKDLTALAQPEQRWVLVKYSMTRRGLSGKAFMSKQFYAMAERLTEPLRIVGCASS